MIRLILIISILTLTLAGCSESNDPSIDCSLSDLSFEVVSFVKSDCDEPGSVTLQAEGGEGDYVYSVDGENFQSSNVLENLFAGDLTLVVKDGVGCSVTKGFTLESEPTGITMSLSSTESDCIDDTGTVTVEASGGVGTLTFSFDNGDFGIITHYDNVSSGMHTVTAKDDEGCQVTKAIQITTGTSLLNDIMPIIEKDCAISGCHNGSRSPRLITTEEVIQNADFIKSETQAGSMPRDRTLTQNEIELIACWVDDGAKNN